MGKLDGFDVALEIIFDEDDLFAFSAGGCLDFAGGLSKALGDIQHDFLVMLAPDGRNAVVAHVAVRIGEYFYDSEGCHDKLDLMIEWSARSGISHDCFDFVYVTTTDEVRRIAKRIKCDFDSDDVEVVDEVCEVLSPAIDKLRAQTLGKSELSAFWHQVDPVQVPNTATLSAVKEIAMADFLARWQATGPATKGDLAVGKLVDVCGNLAVYSLGRGKHAYRTFGPDEVVPSLEDNEQSAPSQSMSM